MLVKEIRENFKNNAGYFHFFLRGPLDFGKPLLKKLYALVTRHGEIMPVLAWKYPLSWPTFTLIGTPKLQ